MLLISISLISCQQTPSAPPYNLGVGSSDVIVVPYEEMGGVKLIPIKLNGITLNMIYDTGCSGLHLSQNELIYLAKNGKIDASDIEGTTLSRIADGSVVENLSVNIREIEVGGEKGIILRDVMASVSQNLDAPVLLGNGVMDAFASVEVDNIDRTINFKRR